MTIDIVFGRSDVDFPAALLLERQEWGVRTLDLVNPPRRFWSDLNLAIPAVELGIDFNRVRRLPMPTELLASLPADDNWPAHSRRSIARLQAYFLICEDPQRRLDAREVETLAHQVSLVRHILGDDHLRRVLIADEVGLGKTVEVGLIIKELLEHQPGLRILYLSPARLVNNVRREFERLGLLFRQWTAIDGDAKLTMDPKIIASIHRAVHGKNFDRVTSAKAWDVIVVDECHHLSAWEPGGENPKEAYKLVRKLIQQQASDGRVIFLSGTPHQGNIHRFENLVALLRHDSEPSEALAGRVIYRTKDDIRDWEQNPIFPPRQVNEPLVVNFGPRYREWIENIHRFYQPSGKHGGASEAKQRAAGWRCAQALQWAASSPLAGMGYLVRQAIRAKWDLRSSILKDAVAALRPYRLGVLNEPVEQLYQRIVKEVARQDDDRDVEDIEDDDSVPGSQIDSEGLDELLRDGLKVLRECGDWKWEIIKGKLLDTAGGEKVVLFAQPIETVIALARFLEKEFGERPAIIIGGQSDAERQKEVESFQRPDGPQFLVSSKAGGEGINLQIAHRLVHIDVPWNPMDLEQRVGRVHRFGSRRTIIVDTIVVKDSREADAYRVAREKLRLIANTLVERERFESIFSRVMCLVPPEQLQEVLICGPQAPFTGDDQDKIGQMVQQGFKAWKDFHERFGDQQKLIHQQDPGLAAWADVGRFLQEYAKAKPAEGFKSQRFTAGTDGNGAVEKEASVLVLEDGKNYAAGETNGTLVFGPDGRSVRQLGLNQKPVAEVLRKLAFPESHVGAAHLRWNSDYPLPELVQSKPFGILILVRQTVRTDPQAGWIEQSTSLCGYIMETGKEPIAIDGKDKGVLLRGIFAATVRNKPEQDDQLRQQMSGQEVALIDALRQPTEREMRFGVRHAVIPLFAGIMS